ncbi:hypothetical protein ATK36_3446 [Amycolatopsis sulphurea]|uniref:PPE family protein n=1 Tax=Amycolatopsis sulphurea TaxID=76022 RepID=A0A2A9FC79_9PSEU|nr:hypothetical protein [Amycolatopsis sulphurea]PFG48361.1 hypothetical protein ATK36_3446 [Amycolatopsis sulphurea]
MGNGDNGSTLKNVATGAVVGGAVGGPVGAVVGGAVGGLVSMFSGGPSAENLQANVGGGSISAYDIYQQISKGNTASLENGKTGADQLKGKQTDRAGAIEALNNKLTGAWKGDSAAAAQGGAGALKIWHEDSARNLGTSGTFITNQLDAFHNVKGKVQKLPDDPPEMSLMDHAPWSDKDDEINKYNQDSQTNVQAYTAYYGSSNQNAGGMPQYNVWQGNNISDGGTTPHIGTGGTGSVGGVGTGGVGSGGKFGGGGSFTPPKTNTPKLDTPSFDPSKTRPPAFTPPKTDIPRFDPSNDTTSASSYVPPNPDSSSFGPGGSGGFGSGGFGGAGFGPGGSGGGSGSGSGAGGVGSAAFGPGAFGAGGMGSGAAAEGAAGGGAGSGARGAGMGAGGAAGRSGASGMGGMGAHGGGKKGEDDQEHQTKYLLEEDNNELFGSDELTVPPVIGE